MDIYNLINSKAIGEHCRKIKHKFNTEEIAVLIYRNKNMSIKEKISLYKELIEKYPDMEVIERINCKHYDSVKDMIKKEIERLERLVEKLLQDEENVIYTYNSYYITNYTNRIIEGRNEINNICTTYKETNKLIIKEIEEDEENELVGFRVTKRKISQNNKYEIGAEYKIDENKDLKMINIYEFKQELLDISNICLNIPTPFKKGDLLIAYSKTPFSEGYILSYNRFPFVLEYLCNWNERFQELLDKGNHDSSDMQGPGYFIDESNLICDNVFDYDSWEYFEGELEGMDRILIGVSNLIKENIGVEIFLDAYENIKAENEKEKHFLSKYTKEGLQLAGISKKEIKKIYP